MDKNYCLSTPLHSFLKYYLSKLSVILQYLQYQVSQLFIQSSLLFQQQQNTREYELLTSMLNSKLGHRKEYFFFSIHCLWIKTSQKPIPLLHFCLENLNHDFEINLQMADFSMASSPELHEIMTITSTYSTKSRHIQLFSI